jgi:D-inositol-3-phosphate glycosyltransferase
VQSRAVWLFDRQDAPEKDLPACCPAGGVTHTSDLSGGRLRIALLTAGKDPHYALGLTSGLSPLPIDIDFIGNDDMQHSPIVAAGNIDYYNLRRGDQSASAKLARKGFRVIDYYARLLGYAAGSRADVFHILWLNKFTYVDMTALTLYYKALGKKLVHTAHNINIRQRDGKDNFLNRFMLAFFYRNLDHIMVHTHLMKQQLGQDYRVDARKITVIPFGINNVLPETSLSRTAARGAFNFSPSDRVVLFFGNIAPYKGLEYLVDAFGQLATRDPRMRLVIAGQLKCPAAYWRMIQTRIRPLAESVIQRIEYIPDEQIELFFKAADVLVLPYTHIFQSGVLFLSYQFGLPAVCTDVGSMREEVQPGHEFLVCPPQNSTALAERITSYFNSDLFLHLEQMRGSITRYTQQKNSWQRIGQIHLQVYRRITGALDFEGLSSSAGVGNFSNRYRERVDQSVIE